jgi:hypothetical protein
MITDFYQNACPDSEGRRLDEIWALSDEELMHAHDWIQWLFPTDRESGFNPDAPVLTARDVALFRANPELRRNLETSFHRWLKVLGLGWEEGRVVGNGDTYVFKTQNHNWLRFSRVIRSLSMLGLPVEAERFLDFVLEHTDPTLSKDSRPYWKAALRPRDG